MIRTYPTLRPPTSSVHPHPVDHGVPGAPPGRSTPGPPLPSNDASSPAFRRLRPPRRGGVRGRLGSAALLLARTRPGAGDRAADPRGRGTDVRILGAPGDDHDPVHEADRA